jgi:hypothetical protein
LELGSESGQTESWLTAPGRTAGPTGVSQWHSCPWLTYPGPMPSEQTSCLHNLCSTAATSGFSCLSNSLLPVSVAVICIQWPSTPSPQTLQHAKQRCMAELQ